MNYFGSMRAFRLVAVVLVCFLTGALAGAQQKILILANNFEPYYGESLPDHGPFLNIVETALRRVGYDPVVQFFPWARVIAQAETGLCDIIVGVWSSRGRETWLALSDPILNNEIGLLKLKGDPLEFIDFKSLARENIIVGSVSGYINPADLERAGVRVENVPEDLLNIRKLYAHRIRLAVIERKIAEHLIAKERLSGQFEWVASLETLSLYAGIIKKADGKWRTLRADLNSGLAGMRADGTLQKLSEGLY